MLPRLGGHSQIMFTERFYVCTRSEQHDDNPLNFGKIPFRSATSASTTISLCLSSKWSFATNKLRSPAVILSVAALRHFHYFTFVWCKKKKLPSRSLGMDVVQGLAITQLRGCVSLEGRLLVDFYRQCLKFRTVLLSGGQVHLGFLNYCNMV